MKLTLPKIGEIWACSAFPAKIINIDNVNHYINIVEHPMRNHPISLSSFYKGVLDSSLKKKV